MTHGAACLRPMGRKTRVRWANCRADTNWWSWMPASRTISDCWPPPPANRGRWQVETVLIERDADGLVAISQALARYRDLDAVHIVSHASPGKLQLGRTELSDATLQTSGDLVRGWGRSLAADADILLYGCDLAANETGRQFVRELSLLTGADVAASTDATGNAARGGDWNLEFTVGSLETSAAVGTELQASWSGLLAAVPSATLSVPARPFIGDAVNFTVTFDNTSATDTGYGPFVDLIMPKNGADGATSNPQDGLTFSCATYSDRR